MRKIGGDTAVKDSGFTKAYTDMTKSLLVVMMLAHHVFFGDAVGEYGVKTLLSDPVTVSHLVTFCKICIAGFAFLSAYGMTKAFQKQEDVSPKALLVLCMRRLLKLLLPVCFLYMLALLYKGAVMGQNIQMFYMGEDKSLFRLFLFMVIDVCGLAAYFGLPAVNVTWWYLSYAILLIFAMPFLFLLYRKFRQLLLPVACLLPAVTLTTTHQVLFTQLLPIAVLGIAFAYEGWFAPPKSRRSGGAKFLLYLVLFGLCYELAIYVNFSLGYLLAFTIPGMVYYGLGRIPVLRQVLLFVGKHATNIFLIHTFLYLYFHADFIYSFRRDWLILLALLGTSLAVSIVVELLKKATGYQWLCGKLLRAFDAAFSGGDVIGGKENGGNGQDPLLEKEEQEDE